MPSSSTKLAAGVLAPKPLLACRVVVLLSLLVSISGCSRATGGSDEKVVYMPMDTGGPNTLDPVRGSSTYDNTACNKFYQTLLQYRYLHRPFELEPLLLERMPEVSKDRTVYRFKLKKNILFHDDDCFPNGKGRELIAQDFFYSLKRLADNSNKPKSWWLMKDTIVGFDEYREQQNQARKAGGKFDYDLPIEGMKIINDHEFEVHLKQPFYRFVYTLAMFQTSLVPREAVEKYGGTFERHPVGTGPFTLTNWKSGSRMTLVRNPNYWEERYPADPGLNADGGEPYEGYLRDKELGFYEDAGKRLPLVDRVEIAMFVNRQPMWLKFRNRELDYTMVPAESFPKAFVKRTRKLREEFVEEGMTPHAVPLIDFIFYGFNMEDKDFGGYSDKKKWVRQAISLAIDFEEKNDAFYNGNNLIYDGPIPASLEGHPPGHTVDKNYRGPDLRRARELLAKAGHPDGEGLPRLDYYLARQAKNAEQAEMTERHLAKIGIKLDTRLVDFSTLTDLVRNKRAPFFSYAWSSDYPDAENNLQLFYGPFKSPSSNSYNYDNPEYNKLYDKVRVMQPSPERTKLYEQMRDMIIEDAPMIGSMARTRQYLVHKRLRNCKPVEAFSNWAKYLNVN